MEDVQVSLVHHRECQLNHLTFRKWRHVQFPQATPNAEDRRPSYLKMYVRTLVLDRKSKNLVDLKLFTRIKRGLFPVCNQNHVAGFQ
jgi:hypothetical protein